MSVMSPEEMAEIFELRRQRGYKDLFETKPAPTDWSGLLAPRKKTYGDKPDYTYTTTTVTERVVEDVEKTLLKNEVSSLKDKLKALQAENENLQRQMRSAYRDMAEF